jgi:hypothetical protein
VTEAQWLWTALIVVTALGNGVTAWAVITNRASRTQIEGDVNVNPPREYVLRGSYETHCRLNREHHEKIEARVAALERKLETDKDEIIEAGEIRATKLHDRINVAIEKIGELRGEVTHLSKK